jgi:hypothetical protein
MATDDSKSIIINGYGELPFIDTDYNNFYRHTTILYGPSETGKTVVLLWLCKILQQHCPSIIVIAPTNGSNGTYKGIVPDRCVYTTIAIEKLRDVWLRQEEATAIYNQANDIKVLASLFIKANDMKALGIVRKMQELYQATLRNISSSVMLDAAQKQEQRASIKKKITNRLTQIYKRTISHYKDTLRGLKLTKEEGIALKYLNFNPSLLLIMDDVTSQIELWGKDPVIAKIFYEGRHNWITSIYTMQTDNKLAPGIRMNTFTSIFTDPQTAMRYFNNKENSFTTIDKRKAQIICDALFKESEDGVENHKKFVYMRRDKKHKFRYVIADIVEGLRMGSPELWHLCEKLPSPNEKSLLGDNKFAKSFRG